MKVIESLNNPKLKEIRKLANKKDRQKNAKFLLEGKKIVETAIANNVKIKDVFVRAGDADAIAFAKSNLLEYSLVSDTIFDKLSTTVQPQGIVCICEQTTLQFAVSTGNSLILDNVSDPGNLGAIFRVAAATDFKDIYMINCVDCFNEKVIRASMGNIFYLNLYKTNYDTILKRKIDFKSKFVLADMTGTNLFDIHLPKSPLTVIIGNEGNGVSDTLKSIADIQVSIPMKNGVESLNAAVSTAVILYILTKGDYYVRS